MKTFFSKSAQLWGVLASILGVPVVLILVSPLSSPSLGRDQGVFVYIGQQILLGRIPYRDMWDHKGPLIYYANAIGLSISHNSLWGVWLVETFIITFALLLYYRQLREILTTKSAVFGIFTWLAGFSIVMAGNIVEEYTIILVVLALYLVRYRPRFSALLAGVLAGFAFLVRPNEVAAPSVALLLMLEAPLRANRWLDLFARTVQLLLGFLIVVGSICIFFVLKNAFGDFISSAFIFNYYYVAGGDILSSAILGVAYLSIPVLFSIPTLLLSLFSKTLTLSGDQRNIIKFALGLLLISVPLSLLSGRPYPHYYIP